VISGNLLCSKEEACALAGIQLRIEETSSNRCTSRMDMHGEQNEAYSTPRAQPMVCMQLITTFVRSIK